MSNWRRQKRQNASQQPSLPGLFAPFTKFRRLATHHEQALDVAHIRLSAAFFMFALAWLVIAARLTELTVFTDAPDPPITHAQSDESTAIRADLTDRNGAVLATSVRTNSLCVDSKKLLNADEAKQQLLTVMPDLDPKKLDEDLHSGKHCSIIHRHLSPRQTYAINKLGIVGLEFQPDEGRLYPAGSMMAHITGYTDIDDKGLAGTEKEFEQTLQEHQEPVALSVDLRLQTIMHDELGAAMSQFHAIGGGGLIMDVSTGEILAMVSLPDFDPMHAGSASDISRFNRDTLGVYEMGSTFKIFNTALALDSGIIHVGDTFDTIHPISVGGHVIHDFEAEKRWLNVAEIFTHSSNIGSAHMAEKLGAARQRAFLGKLGLTEKQPLEFPEVGAPLVPDAEDWGPSTVMTAAFGQGIAVNAVQLASAVATIVNDGVPVHPTLLKQTGAPSAEGKKKDHVISARTSAMVRGMMRLVVTRGTARGNDVAGYLLGGKTGTADKIVNHRYSKDSRLSSFVGVFPINAPRYLVFAMLDEPKAPNSWGFATGGKVAAPVVSHVVSRIGPLLNVAPLDPDMAEAAERQLFKPLQGQMVDGLPVDEGSNYASNESDRVQ